MFSQAKFQAVSLIWTSGRCDETELNGGNKTIQGYVLFIESVVIQRSASGGGRAHFPGGCMLGRTAGHHPRTEQQDWRRQSGAAESTARLAAAGLLCATELAESLAVAAPRCRVHLLGAGCMPAYLCNVPRGLFQKPAWAAAGDGAQGCFLAPQPLYGSGSAKISEVILEHCFKTIKPGGNYHSRLRRHRNRPGHRAPARLRVCREPGGLPFAEELRE